MKRVLLLSCAACIALAACLTGPAVTPSAGPAAAPAAQTTSAFGQYGLRLVSTGPLDGVSSVEAVVASGQDLKLDALVMDAATGEIAPEETRVDRSGDTWKVTAALPRSGSFFLVLVGKPAADPENRMFELARWKVEARVDEAARNAPRRETRSAFDRLGLKVAAESPLDGVADLSVTLESAQALELAYGLSNRTLGGEEKVLHSLGRGKEGRWTVEEYFSASGLHVLNLYGKPAGGGGSYEKLAAWYFRAEVPEGQVTYSRFEPLGLKVVSCTPQAGVAEAEVVLSSDRELKLFYFVKSRTDTDGSTIYLSPYRENGAWRIPVYFTETGDYTLYLHGGPPDDQSATGHRLAVWQFHAEVPEDGTVYSSFARFGLKQVSAAPRSGVGEAEIVLSTAQGLRVQAALVDRSTGQEVGGAAVGRVDGRWKVLALFPADGDYELRFSAAPAASEDRPELAARWRVQARVERPQPTYVFGLNEQLWKVAFSRVEPAEGQQPSVWRHTAYRGRLAGKLDLRAQGAVVSLREGSEVLFWAREAGIGRIETTLPAAVNLKVGDGQLQCPAGTRLAFDSSSWDALTAYPGRETAFTVGKLAFRTAEEVRMVLYPDSTSFYFTSAAAARISTGKISFTAPAGSGVYWDGQAHQLGSVTVTSPITVPFKGQPTEVPAEDALYFDEQGNLVEIGPGGC